MREILPRESFTIRITSFLELTYPFLFTTESKYLQEHLHKKPVFYHGLWRVRVPDAKKTRFACRQTGSIDHFTSVKTVYYFTFSTIALNASGWFIAKSARTLRLISISFFFNNPINCEYDIPSKRAAALIR